MHSIRYTWFACKSCLMRLYVFDMFVASFTILIISSMYANDLKFFWDRIQKFAPNLSKKGGNKNKSFKIWDYANHTWTPIEKNWKNDLNFLGLKMAFHSNMPRSGELTVNKKVCRSSTLVCWKRWRLSLIMIAASQSQYSRLNRDWKFNSIESISIIFPSIVTFVKKNFFWQKLDP